MRALRSPYAVANALAIVIWLVLWLRFDVQFYAPGDDIVATPALIALVGAIPAFILGWLAGWVEHRSRAAHWLIVLFSVGVAFAWAALVTLLSGDIYYCDDCEVHGIHRTTGFLGLAILLLVFWLSARRAGRSTHPQTELEEEPV